MCRRGLRRGNFSDRGLLYLCLFLASVCGLVAVGVGVYKSQAEREERVRAELTDSDQIEKMLPELSRLIEVLSGSVTQERSFVIFESGTIVVLAEPCEDPKAEACRVLVNTAKSPKFSMERIEGAYGVSFTGNVFTRLEERAVKKAREGILNQWKNFLDEEEEERIQELSEEPDFLTKVGLVARSFMLRDAEGLKVAKILKAKPGSTPVREKG